MDDIVHFMLRLEIDASSVEILQDDTAHCRGGLGRKIESLVRDLLRATAACDAKRWSLGKTKTSGSVRTRLKPKSPMDSSGRMKAASSLRLIKALASTGE